MDRLINMMIRRVIGRLINRGIDEGATRLTRGGPEATPEQQAQARRNAGQAKQALRLARRVGRF